MSDLKSPEAGCGHQWASGGWNRPNWPQTDRAELSDSARRTGRSTGIPTCCDFHIDRETAARHPGSPAFRTGDGRCWAERVDRAATARHRERVDRSAACCEFRLASAEQWPEYPAFRTGDSRWTRRINRPAAARRPGSPAFRAGEERWTRHVDGAAAARWTGCSPFRSGDP